MFYLSSDKNALAAISTMLIVVYYFHRASSPIHIPLGTDLPYSALLLLTFSLSDYTLSEVIFLQEGPKLVFFICLPVGSRPYIILYLCLSVWLITTDKQPKGKPYILKQKLVKGMHD